jgi:hypothetical protein
VWFLHHTKEIDDILMQPDSPVERSTREWAKQTEGEWPLSKAGTSRESVSFILHDIDLRQKILEKLRIRTFELLDGYFPSAPAALEDHLQTALQPIG